MRSGSRLTPTCASCKNKAVRSASIFIAHRYTRPFFKLEHKAHVIPTMLHLSTVFMCSHYHRFLQTPGNTITRRTSASEERP